MHEKIIVWGTGGMANWFCKIKLYNNNYDILAFTDNNQTKWDSVFGGKKVINPNTINEIQFDKILVCMENPEDVVNQLISDFLIPRHKIITILELIECIRNKVCDTLEQRNREENDKEVNEVIEDFKANGINIFGTFRSDKTDIYSVFYDSGNYPYVNFEGKRMYFPKNYNFWTLPNGRKVIKNLLMEQDKESPHLYIKSEYDILPDSVIVDAGVCEGNFALRYIDNAKKIYLIESDDVWIECLKRTFQPYKDKVVFCNKYLGRRDNDKFVTLDKLIKEKVNFIKMDVEGAEVDALLGSKKTLEKSDAKCAICSYHKQYDEKYIRFLLEQYGYKTSTSRGYMFFIYDDEIASSLDLRRGIVYAEKLHSMKSYDDIVLNN